MLCRNVAVALCIFVHSFLAARRFMADYFTRYHPLIYHLEHKQIITGFKMFRWSVFTMVYVDFFGGKIYKAYPIKLFVKNCQGKRCANFSQFSRQKC